MEIISEILIEILSEIWRKFCRFCRNVKKKVEDILGKIDKISRKFWKILIERSREQ